MATIAIYSLKGGVGKTTLAVNLAHAAATVSQRRTLLWDLDPQAGASFVLGAEGGVTPARALFAKTAAPDSLARETLYPNLHLIAADPSLRGLDRLFMEVGKRRRLAKLIDGLAAQYDRVLLDCPPGLTETSEQVMRAANIIIVPVIPSPLSQRAFDAVVAHIDRLPGRRAAILPIHMMVDRRRSIHRAAIDAHPDWPIVPMTSALEAMASERAAIGAFAPRSPGAAAIAHLWTGIERRLARGA
ncbi:cellulose biosynthesis protein BcsQ [Sphingomonas jejuensis]|uniref:Cellulose biosynthesis protein BcsQ n=1 Tax=Sphingomonas jejuensis TaxID=904715 RepID=A0ABX0XM52_9SPHN|nr:cellulose biosynthesis protein BcsQ [Sphingomonas jejuensis]